MGAFGQIGEDNQLEMCGKA